MEVKHEANGFLRGWWVEWVGRLFASLKSWKHVPPGGKNCIDTKPKTCRRKVATGCVGGWSGGWRQGVKTTVKKY